MSDIGASESVETAAPVAEATETETTESFDLDSAVEEFATNAPDEWKGKAGKIQSELKNLRAKYAPYRDAFDGVHESDRDAVFGLVSAIKAGDSDAAATWMVEAAKGLTGEQFEEKFGFTKAEAKAAIAEAEATEAESEPELSIEERIQKALDDRDASHKEQLENQKRQEAINLQFSEFGYDVTRKEDGSLADFTTKIVAQLALDHSGDIKAAHEAFQKLQGDWAKNHLQKHAGDETLSPGQGAPATTETPIEGEENMTAAEKGRARVKARMMRQAGGAAV